MKCDNCGGNLTLEDVVCPHCEAINPHAIEHIREMKRYQKDYEGTKDEVYNVTKRYIGVSVRIIAIAILIVLIILCGIICDESYSINRKLMQAKAKRNYDENTAIIDAYLDEGDYYALYVFLEENYINTSFDVYDAYDPIIYATTRYGFLYSYIIRYRNTDSVESLQSYPTRIEEELSSLYKLYDAENYVNVEGNPEQKEQVLRIEEQVNALLVTYCGLTMEEADSLQEMSKAQRLAVLEERLLNEK